MHLASIVSFMWRFSEITFRSCSSIRPLLLIRCFRSLGIRLLDRMQSSSYSHHWDMFNGCIQADVDEPAQHILWLH